MGIIQTVMAGIPGVGEQADRAPKH